MGQAENVKFQQFQWGALPAQLEFFAPLFPSKNFRSIMFFIAHEGKLQRLYKKTHYIGKILYPVQDDKSLYQLQDTKFLKVLQYRYLKFLPSNNKQRAPLVRSVS